MFLFRWSLVEVCCFRVSNDVDVVCVCDWRLFSWLKMELWYAASARTPSPLSGITANWHARGKFDDHDDLVSLLTASVVRLASSVSCVLVRHSDWRALPCDTTKPLHVCERILVNGFCVQTILVSFSDAKAFSNVQSKAGRCLSVANDNGHAISPIKEVAVGVNITDCGSAC